MSQYKTVYFPSLLVIPKPPHLLFQQLSKKDETKNHSVVKNDFRENVSNILENLILPDYGIISRIYNSQNNEDGNIKENRKFIQSTHKR